jgi:tRNA (adenine22-N1)-methyltransferase
MGMIVGSPSLPRRLRAVAEAVPTEARSLVDVGAGDGQLALHLARRGLHVVATEAGRGPFDRLCAALPGFDCRLGDGLEAVQPGEVDGAVIAGMGGRTIVRILERSPEVVARLRWLVLQPQQHLELLLEWLERAGYQLESRREVIQGRHRYTVLLVGPFGGAGACEGRKCDGEKTVSPAEPVSSGAAGGVDRRGSLPS